MNDETNTNESPTDQSEPDAPAQRRVRIVIPTLNAAGHLDELLPALAAQGIAADDVTVIDSGSRDTTVERFEAFGARLMRIDTGEFDHGGARQRVVDAHPEADIFVMLTQDALPAPGAVDALVAAFDDDAVAIAYGRQAPRRVAGPIERFAREHNYSTRGERRTFEDRARFGVRTVFCSNSFCAWRARALAEVGGFPVPIHFGEDQVTAAKLLQAGHALCYQADAVAEHSHGYSIVEDFQRYFDVGALHGRHPWLRETFGVAERDGFRFVIEESRYLLRTAPLLLPSAYLRTFAKYLGYRIGLREQGLSRTWAARLSSQGYFWRREASAASA